MNNLENIIKNIEEYNPNKKCKISIVFDDMIADMFNKKKLNPIVRQSCFAEAKNIKLNSMHYFIMKIPNKNEFQHSASYPFIRY